MIEQLGTFFFTNSVGFTRKYFLWAVIDDEGDVCAIHYGTSNNHLLASGEVLRNDCDSKLRKFAFSVAEDRWEAGRIDDQEEETCH